MEEEEAHQLYQQFQKTDAAAKQKQGLGFGSSAASQPLVDNCRKPSGWEAPYKLSDKFQAPGNTTSKRSRCSHSHRHSPDKRNRDHSSSPDQSLHRRRDKVGHHKQASKEQPARHHSREEHREEHRQSSSRKRHSRLPDSRYHRERHSASPDGRYKRHHRSSSHTDTKRESARHTRREDQSSHTHRERPSHHRSRDVDDHQRHRSTSRSGAATSNHTLKAPDYAKLIVGYKYMSDANRLKAVTAYKLSKTSAKDVPSQDGKPWTRFVFNNEALLEEEGAAPDSPGQEGQGPAGLGAFDFRPHRSAQIGKPAEDAHEAAIFGAPTAQSGMLPLPCRLPSASGSDSDERPQIVELQETPHLSSMTNADAASAPQIHDLASGTATAPKMSWRERALLKKQHQTVT